MESIIEAPAVTERQRRNRKKTEYNARWYYFGRLALIKQLGGKCVDCGTKGRNKKNRLELDHIHGRDWKPREKSRWQRLTIYRREAAEGKLAVRCAKCNKLKGYSGNGTPPAVGGPGPGERGESA